MWIDNTPHSAKSKSGSNKLAHLVKKRAYRMHWMAYYLVRMVNGLFVCPIKATGKKHSGNEASQLFFLALLVKLTKATQLTPVRIDHMTYFRSQSVMNKVHP